MKDDAARLRRARLIERVRVADQRRCAADAFQAESDRRKFESLAGRTRSLAQAYAARPGTADGADLRGAALLAGHLHEIGRTVARRADEARRIADGRIAELAAAERRRQRAGDETRALHREVLDRLGRPDPLLARKPGTHLE